MNINDFRAKAYGAGSKSDNAAKAAGSSDDIKAKDKTENKPSSSQELENSVSFLKTGGLLKVPVEQTAPDGSDSVYRRVQNFFCSLVKMKRLRFFRILQKLRLKK